MWTSAPRLSNPNGDRGKVEVTNAIKATVEVKSNFRDSEYVRPRFYLNHTMSIGFNIGKADAAYRSSPTTYRMASFFAYSLHF
jgi:hypothetical protein